MRCSVDADERVAQAMMQERKTSSSVMGAYEENVESVKTMRELKNICWVRFAKVEWLRRAREGKKVERTTT